MTPEVFPNVAIGFLNGGITSSATSITLQSGHTFPAGGNFMVKIDNEIIQFTATTSTTATAVRAQEGTTGATHSDGAVVYGVITQGSLGRLNAQYHGGTITTQRRNLNFVDGGGAAWTLADDPSNNACDVSVAVSGTGQSALTAPPLSSTLSWTNQGTSTVVDDTNGLHVIAQITTGTNSHLMTKSMPATPYNFIIKAFPTVYSSTNHVAGMCIEDSVSGKLMRFAWSGNIVLIDKLTSPTNWNSQYTSQPPGIMNLWTWLRLHDDGTNFTFYASGDGIAWTQIYQVSRTDWLSSPNQLGVVVESNNAGSAAEIKVVSWYLGT